MAVLRAVRMAVRSSRWFVLGAVAMQVVAALGAPAQLATVRVIVDRVVTGGAVVTLVLLLVTIVIAQRLAALAMSSLLTLAREHAGANAVSAYLEKAATIDAGRLNDPAFLDRMRHAGEVADERFGSALFGVVGLLGGLTAATALTALLATISPVVAALVVASLAPWVFAEQRGYRIVRAARTELLSRRRRQSYLRGLVTDADAALELLASGGGTAVARRHTELSEELLRLERPAHIRQFATIAVGDLVGAILLAAAFVVAIHAHASAGDVAAAVAALAAFLGAAAGLANALSGLLSHGPYLRDYFAFLDTPPVLAVPARPARLPATLAGGLVFDDVTYRYPGTAGPAVERVSLTVEPGELLAIVGPNGAGKTTLIKLLLRFYDPDGGRITLGGVDLRDCDPADIRSRVGVVFQDFARYQFTVRDTVRMGRPGGANDDDDERVATALRAADAQHALDTQVGRLLPGGHDLSGGQWQRLAIARLFYRDADVLVLDEPTASLDAAGEERTFRAVRERLDGRIGIVISHRPSTVQMADRVLTLTPWTDKRCAPSRNR